MYFSRLLKKGGEGGKGLFLTINVCVNAHWFFCGCAGMFGWEQGSGEGYCMMVGVIVWGRAVCVGEEGGG